MVYKGGSCVVFNVANILILLTRSIIWLSADLSSLTTWSIIQFRSLSEIGTMTVEEVESFVDPVPSSVKLMLNLEEYSAWL